MIRLLILSPTNNPANGYGNITNELCTFLAQKTDLTLLLPVDHPRIKQLEYKVEYVLPSYVASLKTPKIINYIMYRCDFKADIVHSLFEFPYDFLAALISIRQKIPLVVGSQGTFGVTMSLRWPERYLVRWIYRIAKRIVVPSWFTKMCVEIFSKTKTPVSVIHNGVNYPRFKMPKSPVRKSKNNLIFLTVGGLKERKGQDLVIKALGKNKDKLPKFKYLIVGKGTWEPYLKKLAREVGIVKQVEFLGELTGDRLVSVFRKADIYVHTPKMVNWNFEGFGIVYLEASACQLPIVATDSGGVRDAVVNNKTGIIVPENNIAALGKALVLLAENGGLRKKMGSNGGKYAQAHDWTIIGQKYLDVYLSLI